MIGRTDDVRELALALENATNCVIAGPRRTGKTSVCEAALLRAAKRGHYVARVDLFKIADAGELAEALVTAVLENRRTVYKAVLKARRLGRTALSAAQAALTTKLTSELGDAVEI